MNGKEPVHLALLTAKEGEVPVLRVRIAGRRPPPPPPNPLLGLLQPVSPARVFLKPQGGSQALGAGLKGGRLGGIPSCAADWVSCPLWEPVEQMGGGLSFGVLGDLDNACHMPLAVLAAYLSTSHGVWWGLAFTGVQAD